MHKHLKKHVKNKNLILPYLSYSGLTWHFCKKTDSNKLERLNERGLRAVYNDWRAPYSELLIRAKMSSLYNRRLQDIAILMFKVKNKLAPENISELFRVGNTERYSLRNSDFTLPRVNTICYGRHSLRFHGPFLWAKLPSDIRNCKTLKSFKSKVRRLDLAAKEDKSCPAGCLLCNM